MSVIITELQNDRTFRRVVPDALRQVATEVMKGSPESEIESRIALITELFMPSTRQESIGYTHYFARYFSYALEPGDVLDAELDIVVEKIRSRMEGFTVHDDVNATGTLKILAESSPERLLDALHALTSKLSGLGMTYLLRLN